MKLGIKIKNKCQAGTACRCNPSAEITSRIGVNSRLPAGDKALFKLSRSNPARRTIFVLLLAWATYPSAAATEVGHAHQAQPQDQPPFPDRCSGAFYKLLAVSGIALLMYLFYTFCQSPNSWQIARSRVRFKKHQEGCANFLEQRYLCFVVGCRLAQNARKFGG